MKKLFQKLSFVALAASIGFLYSCGEDEEVFDVPVITFSPVSGASVQVGEDLDVTVTVVAAGGFNVLRATNGTQTVEFPRGSQGVTMNADNTQAEVTITLGGEEVGEYTVTFTAVDDQDQVTEATYMFTTTSPDALIQTEIIFAAPLGNGASYSFYSVDDNTLYRHNDVMGTTAPVSSTIDLCYYYGNTDQASIVSPAMFPAAIFDISGWGTKNETAMIQVTNLSAEQFNALTTVADVEAVLESVSNEDAYLGYTGLSVNDIIAFETTSGTAGVFIVRALNTGFTGSIELEMILAKAAE